MSENQSAVSQYQNIHRLILQGQLENAGRACQSLVEEHPTFAPGWAAFSELWLRCGVLDKAGAAAQHGLQIEPESSELATQLAKCMHFSGQLAGAMHFANIALKNGPDTVIQLDTLGNIFARFGKHETATELFEEAQRLAPDSPGIMFNLATSQRLLGRSEAAEELLNQVLAVNPTDADAHYSLSLVRRQTASENHIERLEKQLDTSRRWQDKVKIRYALAKELEDLERYEASFEQLQEGASLFSQYANYSLEDELAGMASMQNATSKDKLTEIAEMAPPSDVNNNPIFIVGLPGSGTKIVEQILAAHSEVETGGDVRTFQAATAHGSKQSGSKITDLAHLAGLIDELDYPAVAKAYLEMAELQVGATKHFLDTFPLNVFQVPVIHMALPTARIILIERDPLETGYAMFKTLFQNGFHASYDLETLAKYHLSYQQWVDHLKKILPSGALLTLRHADIVSEPEGELQRLLDFCALGSQEACSDSARAITSSAVAGNDNLDPQVFDEVTNHYKNVEKHMAVYAQTLARNEANT